jgi:hypothetical protein
MIHGLLKKNNLRTSQQKCVANTRWLNWGATKKKKKTWRGGKGSGKY